MSILATEAKHNDKTAALAKQVPNFRSFQRKGKKNVRKRQLLMCADFNFAVRLNLVRDGNGNTSEKCLAECVKRLVYILWYVHTKQIESKLKRKSIKLNFWRQVLSDSVNHLRDAKASGCPRRFLSAHGNLDVWLTLSNSLWCFLNFKARDESKWSYREGRCVQVLRTRKISRSLPVKAFHYVSASITLRDTSQAFEVLMQSKAGGSSSSNHSRNPIKTCPRSQFAT